MPECRCSVLYQRNNFWQRARASSVEPKRVGKSGATACWYRACQVEGESPACGLQADVTGQCIDGEHHLSPLVSSAVGRLSTTHSFFSFNDQFRTLQLVAQAGDITVQMLDLPSRCARLRSALLRCESGAVCGSELFAPTRQHGGINAPAAQECAMVEDRDLRRQNRLRKRKDCSLNTSILGT